MPSYWRVSPRIWTDPELRRATEDTRTLALYLLTCEHRNVIGLFRLPKAYMSEDLQWSLQRLGKPLGELLAMGFLAYDDAAQVVLIRNALKYQAPENDNQVTASLRQLEDLPDTPLTCDFKPLAEQFCQRLAERLPKGFGKPTATATATATATNPIVELPTRSDGSLVQRVIDAWQASTGKQRAQLDDNRRQAIQKALDTYPVDDVLDAVQGWANDPWPERAQQNDICQLLHTGTVRKPLNVLEKMRDLWRDGPPTTAGRQTQELARNANGLSRAFQAMEGGNGGDPRVGTARAPIQRELPGPANRAVHGG